MWKKSQKPIYYFSILCYLWVWTLFFLCIESVELHALKIILTLVKLEWLWYGMVLFTAEVPEVPLLCWPKITCLWTSGCGEVEGEAMAWMGPGSGRLVNGEQRLFSQWRERHAFTCLGAKTERILCQCRYPAQVHPRRQSHYNKMPMFGEGPLQTSNNQCIIGLSRGS